MNIEQALELLRSEYVEEDIKKMQPKDRLQFWANLEEFVRPKLMRGTQHQSTQTVQLDY